MTLEELSEKLTAAGITFKEGKGSRLYITKTPNGSKSDYGYVSEGDHGSTGGLPHILKRSGEIAAALR